MNLNLNHPLRFRLMNADLDAGGTGTGVEDRGDNLAPVIDKSGEGADTEAASAAALQAKLDEEEATAAAAAAAAAATA